MERLTAIHAVAPGIFPGNLARWRHCSGGRGKKSAVVTSVVFSAPPSIRPRNQSLISGGQKW